MRETASLLLSEGHASANVRRYPLGVLWNEYKFARKRIHSRMTTEAVLMHSVIAQAMAGGKHLKDTLERLDDD